MEIEIFAICADNSFWWEKMSVFEGPFLDLGWRATGRGLQGLKRGSATMQNGWKDHHRHGLYVLAGDSHDAEH